MSTAITGLHPVCDSGGQRQPCYDASEQVIAATASFVHALDAQALPPRFARADADLRRALATDIQGLQLRNVAIGSRNNADWVKGNALIKEGSEGIATALREYPSDTGLQAFA